MEPEPSEEKGEEYSSSLSDATDVGEGNGMEIEGEGEEKCDEDEEDMAEN